MTLHQSPGKTDPSASERSPLRACRTVHGDGRVDVNLSAFCRTKGQSVSLEHCLECAQLEALTIGSNGEEAFIRCKPSVSAQSNVAQGPGKGIRAFPAA